MKSYLKKVDKINKDVESKKAERKFYRKESKSLSDNIIKLEAHKEKIDRANVALQYIIEHKQQSIITMFEDTVTSALQEMFDENYTFKLEFHKRNKMSTVDFTINTGEYAGYLPLKMCHGKAVKETIACALRVMFVSMMEGRKILILDESFGGIDVEREHKAGLFLNKICEQFGIQLIIVSHKVGVGDSADNKVNI